MSNAEEGQMTTSDEAASESPSESPAEQLPTPGTLLGAQRETLEYSLQQVADRLNLTMHFVKAIETDSYEKLPGDVFIRGYLRSYAELLQLDPEYVLELYNHFTQRRQARKQEAIKRISRRRKDKNRPWVVVSGIAFVLLALILWYFNQPGDSQELQPDETADVTEQSARADAGNQADPAVRIVEGVNLSPRDSVSPGATSSTTSPESAVDENGTATASVASGRSEAGIEAMSRDDNVSGNVSGQDMSLTTAGAEPSAAIEILETQSLTWPGNDVLDIRFSEESWVEVSHDSGPESHETMGQRGLRLMVNGEGPFTLELGNAEAATVIYNERILAFKNAIRDDGSVRLSVGM